MIDNLLFWLQQRIKYWTKPARHGYLVHPLGFLKQNAWKWVRNPVDADH
jgi:hypothetical protein